MTLLLPKVVIFDFDGVILESADIKTAAFGQLFADYPHHQAAIIHYHLENLGISRFKKFTWIYKELLHRPLSQEEMASLDERFSALVLEQILQCPFVPGALATLRALLGKCLLFVASGTPQHELERIVTARDLRQYFVQIFGSPVEKTQAVQTVLTQFCLQPKDALFVGDGRSDYQAACEAGVYFIARDTLDMRRQWRELGVERVDDLRDFPARIGFAS